MGVPPADLPLATLVGGLALAAPLFIWCRYAGSVASAGGLSAFAAAAGGPRLGRLQAALWTVSYLLYLPYTITYIVYYLLPALLPVPPSALAALEVALPVALSLAILRAERGVLQGLAVSAALQVAAVLALAALGLARAGWPAPPPVALTAQLAGGAQVSFFFICLSLVVYLGGEVSPHAMPRILAGAAALVLALTLLVSPVVARAPATGLPGVSLVRALGLPAAAATGLGLLTLVSIGGLIAAEFIALVRLAGHTLGLARPRAAALIAGLFVVGDAVSLLGPQAFYRLTLAPSLVALYAAQLPVFAAYPFFVRTRRRVRITDFLIAAAACLWALYGLYGAVSRLA